MMFLIRFVDNPVVAGLLAALFMLLPLELPLLLPLQMIIPLPLMLLALRQGMRAGWTASALPLVGAFALGGGLRFPLMILLLFIAFPMLAVWLMRGGWRPGQCAGVAFFLGGVLLTLGLLTAALAGINLEAEVAAGLDGLEKALLTAIKSSKGLNPADLVTFQRRLDGYFNVLALLFPGLLVSGWFFVQVANLLLVKLLVARWNLGRFPEEDATLLRLPHALVWGWIAMATLALATTGVSRQIGMNLGLFLAIAYFFQGLSIVQRGFVHHRVGGTARALFYVAVIFWNELALLITVLGLFDTWADFRRRLFSVKEEDDPSGR